MIYLLRYFNCKSIKILSFYHHKLIGKIQEHEVKNYLMNEIRQFNIIFKKVVILITCVIKDSNQFYLQLFPDYTLNDK